MPFHTVNRPINAGEYPSLDEAFAATPPYGTVFLEPGAEGGMYTRDTPLVIDKPGLTLNGQNAQLATAENAITQLSVQASDVTVRDLRIVGPGGVSEVAYSWGIAALGTVNDNLRNLTFENVEAYNQRQICLELEHVDGFAIHRCRFHDTWHAGARGRSVKDGTVSHNRVRTIKGLTTAYGLTFTKREESETTSPRSTDIAVTNNIIADVSNWEGLDTHGGQRMVFSDNIVTGCKIGVAVGAAPSTTTGPDTYAAIDCTITGNIIDSLVDDGSAKAGITFTGAESGTPGSPHEYSTGIVARNIIRRHGSQDDLAFGGMYLHSTQGAQVVGNVIIEPAPNGIVVYHSNRDMILSENMFLEPWTDDPDVARVACVYVRSEHNTLTLSSNRHRATGSKASALLRNDRGVHWGTNTNCQTIFGVPNDFSECATPYNGTLTHRWGAYTSAGLAKPTVTGSRGGNAALASALAALASQQQIINSSTP